VYPSVIPVTGVSGTVGNLSVELNGVTATGGVNDQFLLVAPGGGTYNLDILDDAFNGNSVTTAVNITVADNGVSPYDTTATSATYVPYDGNVFVSPPEVWNDTWPSSTATTFDSNIPTVPATINRPQGLASVRSYSGVRFQRRPAEWGLGTLHLRLRSRDDERRLVHRLHRA
jgi:hypothetical protein